MENVLHVIQDFILIQNYNARIVNKIVGFVPLRIVVQNAYQDLNL